MNKLLNKLNTILNERKKSFITLGVIIGIVISYISFKELIWENEEKAEIINLIAKKHIDNGNYRTAIFGDSIKNFHDLPEELKGDSIEFNGINEILEDSKLKGTSAAKFSKYLLGISYYNLALEETDEEAKKEYLSKALNSLDNCKSKNKAQSSKAKEVIGDIFLELNQPKTALEYYQKSLKIINHRSNKNTSAKPYLLKKTAVTAKILGEKKLAKDYYQEIKNNFPKSKYAKDIDKYINELSN